VFLFACLLTYKTSATRFYSSLFLGIISADLILYLEGQKIRVKKRHLWNQQRQELVGLNADGSPKHVAAPAMAGGGFFMGGLLKSHIPIREWSFYQVGLSDAGARPHFVAYVEIIGGTLFISFRLTRVTAIVLHRNVGQFCPRKFRFSWDIAASLPPVPAANQDWGGASMNPVDWAADFGFPFFIAQGRPFVGGRTRAEKFQG